MAAHPDSLLGNFLPAQLGDRVGSQLRHHRLERRRRPGAERQLDGALAQRRLVGAADSVGRQHAGQRMDQHPRHPQRIGDLAGVLAAGTAEGHQRVGGDIVAALHRDLLDCVSHVGHCDLEESGGDIGRRARPPGGAFDLARQAGESLLDHRAVERRVSGGAEHPRKMRRVDAAQHQVAVGDRQRTAAAITRRTRIGAGRIWTDPQPAAVEAQHRAAAGRNGVDAHHRRTHPHPGHLGLELSLEFAGVVRDVGRGAPHVEADHPAEPGGRGGLDHADHATCGAGQDRVLALEAGAIGQAAVALHEPQARAAELSRYPVDVAAQDRRQVGIDHRRVAACHELHQRAHEVRNTDLLEAQGAPESGDRALVLRIAPAVHQHHRQRAHAALPAAREFRLDARPVERLQHGAMRVDALVGLEHRRIKHLRQHDVALEQARSVLVADPQRVAKAPGDHQHGRLTAPFEQRIGGHRGAHFDRLDLRQRDRGPRRYAEQAPDALDRRVVVLARAVRQQLERDQRAVGPAADHVGESATAIDPELPACAVHACTKVVTRRRARSRSEHSRSVSASASSRGMPYSTTVWKPASDERRFSMHSPISRMPSGLRTSK